MRPPTGQPLQIIAAGLFTNAAPPRSLLRVVALRITTKLFLEFGDKRPESPGTTTPIARASISSPRD
jgi:hypothetical protein